MFLLSDTTCFRWSRKGWQPGAFCCHHNCHGKRLAEIRAACVDWALSWLSCEGRPCSWRPCRFALVISSVPRSGRDEHPTNLALHGLLVYIGASCQGQHPDSPAPPVPPPGTLKCQSDHVEPLPLPPLSPSRSFSLLYHIWPRRLRHLPVCSSP